MDQIEKKIPRVTMKWVSVLCVSIVILLIIVGLSSPIMAWVSQRLNPGQVGKVLTVGAGYSLGNVTSNHFYYPNGTELKAVFYPAKPVDYICWVSGSRYLSQSGANGRILYNGTDAAAMLQNTLNAMTAGGSVFLKAGVYSLNSALTIPYGLSYYIYGDGIPSFPYPLGAASSTPTDGTQLRFSTSFLSTGTTTNLITSAGGATDTAKGVLSLSNLAIMPPWGTTTSGTTVYGIHDQDSAILIENNIVFVPWGWEEAGHPSPSSTNNLRSQYMAPRRSNGDAAGGGSEARIGYIVEYGMRYGSVFNGFDDVGIKRVVLYRCGYGVTMEGIWDNSVDEISSYDTSFYPIQFTASGGVGGVRGNRVGIINLENPGVNPSVNCPVNLGPSNYVTVDYVFNWAAADNAKYTAITNSPNDSQLEGTTTAYNMGLSGLTQHFPLGVSVLVSNPFGDTVATPFVNSIPYTMGKGGTSGTLFNNRNYTVTTPLDVSIGVGTGQTILVKDSRGNTIDNNVGTLSHRLLLPGYSIKVTYGSLGTFTIIQATVGLGGTTSTPRTNVNYVAYGINLYVTSTDGTSVSISTYDGSGTPGNMMDSSLANITRYRLEEGQVINFGTFSSAPTITVMRVK